eukprot:CAMPEP_0177792180 /NCGR_PEP_ID=MMETSP0491_2-20121128/24386_1 /TAXON_ID=63592 /ORGANISM="Tetraselmis chuii, Strain PLY429" /LENGTH=46 /DNA_ID= /DNA_START= /DNA_END= /DNA_ORIENTATION=
MPYGRVANERLRRDDVQEEVVPDRSIKGYATEIDMPEVNPCTKVSS